MLALVHNLYHNGNKLKPRKIIAKRTRQSPSF